jgi:hypothetical protein
MFPGHAYQDDRSVRGQQATNETPAPAEVSRRGATQGQPGRWTSRRARRVISGLLHCQDGSGVPAGDGWGDLRSLPLWSTIFAVFGGTSEIQRMIIGRAVTGLDVRLPCTYRVNAGAKVRPHPWEVT